MIPVSYTHLDVYKRQDLPHDDAACARQRMTHELLRFAKAYGAYTGAAFSKAKFLAACRDNSHALLPNEPFIAVLGARVSPQLLGQIRCAFSIPCLLYTSRCV